MYYVYSIQYNFDVFNSKESNEYMLVYISQLKLLSRLKESFIASSIFMVRVADTVDLSNAIINTIMLKA